MMIERDLISGNHSIGDLVQIIRETGADPARRKPRQIHAVIVALRSDACCRATN